ncbi:hypothetical protein V0288_12400 [Pannus brasiliensis CCIBt3594]|uniref:Uncharacterized protein n=1 Tax=Pannus brasiliensis CCIBt3594 TaxID=1427578 RepID=A0AAW9QRR8_9CHRO
MTKYDFYRILQNGRIRWYGKLKPARTPGRSIGARIVVEKDPVTGKVLRAWNEVYDREGRVILVHPKRPQDLGHIEIDPETGREISRRD